MHARRTFAVSLIVGAGVLAGCLSGVHRSSVASLGQPVATMSDSNGFIEGVHALSNGTVLVWNQRGNRIRLLDSNLAHAKVVAAEVNDSNEGRLFPYVGDSTLLVIPTRNMMHMIDGEGRVARSWSVPIPPRGVLSEAWGRETYLDPSARLIYQKRLRHQLAGDLTPIETLYVLATDLAGRRPDTLAMGISDRIRPRPGGGFVLLVLMTGDVWVMMRDGTIAMVRASDYHVDWTYPDGRRASSAPIARPRHVLSAADKDSIIAYANRHATAHPGIEVTTTGDTGLRQVPLVQTPGTSLRDTFPVIEWGPSRDIARVDRENNLWIATEPYPYTPDWGRDETLYDVVRPDGRRIRQVRLPAGYNLRGFGPGVAYLSIVANNRLSLAKIRI